MNQAKKKADIKVVILGDAGVGKTTLIHRYLHGIFAQTISTIGASFFLKQWGPYNVAIWDTAGEEKYSGLSSFYCRGASAAILAYDVTREDSLDTLHHRHISLLQNAMENCLIVAVGTKTDLVKEDKDKAVQYSVGEELAYQINEKHGRTRESFSQAPVFETSSKTGDNVDEVFRYIFEICLPLDGSWKPSQEGGITLGEDSQPRSQCKC